MKPKTADRIQTIFVTTLAAVTILAALVYFVWPIVDRLLAAIAAALE